MKFRSPPMPKLPWTAAQWTARKVNELQESPDFVQFCAQWGEAATGEYAALFEAACAQAVVTELTIENLAAVHRHAEELVSEQGGKTGAAPFAFHLHLALLAPYSRLLQSKTLSPAHQPIVAGFIERTSRAAQRAAMVAVSQRLKGAPGGLIGWQAGGSSRS